VPQKEGPPTPLQVRHAAALELVAAGAIDGALALSLVVWPPRGSRLADESVPCGRRHYSDELRAEIRRRRAAGATVPELSRSTGIPHSSIRVLIGQLGTPADNKERAATAAELLRAGHPVQEVAERTGYTQRTVRRIQNEGAFPGPHRDHTGTTFDGVDGRDDPHG
jgi:transposase-like protein